MSQVSRYASLSDEQMEAFHAHCEAFELALRQTKALSLEECMAAAPVEIHDMLFHELLAIELEYRLPRASWTQIAAYQARFPLRHADIERVVGDVSRTWLSNEIPPEAALATVPDHNFERRYQLGSEIARGGMGLIFRGSDTELQRELAIKVLADEHRDNPEAIHRFIKEAQIGGRLQHPGIAPVYELGQFADSRPFFTMKLVQGETLSTILAARNDPGDERAKFLGIFLKVCQTMAYAHEQGVLHRDLKPQNIMVGAFGEVQVMDWGLAKVLPSPGGADVQEVGAVSLADGQPSPQAVADDDSSTDSSRTQMGSVMGTPAYISPEQAQGQVSQLDQRADVFGLGAILCEILTGLPPYVGSNRALTFQSACLGRLDECFARIDASGADGELLTIVKGSLQADLNDRIRDAGVLSQQLANYLESVDLKLRATEMERAAQEARMEQQQRSAARLHNLVLGLAVVAALAVCAAIVAGKAWQDAHIAKESAETSEQLKMLAAASADALRIEAEENLVKAVNAENIAIEQRKRADTAAQTTQQNLYFAEMQLAQRAWQEHRGLLNMRAMLSNWLPHDGAPDRRGWEWFYLNSLPEQNMTTLSEAGDRQRPAAVAWHVPSNRFAEGGPDGSINIRDGSQQEIIQTLKGPIPEVPFWGRTWFAWGRDGTQFVAGGQDGSVQVWETDSGRQLHQFLGFEVPVGGVTFDSGGKYVSAWGVNATIKTWDLNTGLIKNEIVPPAETSTIAWSPDDQFVASGHDEGIVTLTSTSTGETIASWRAHVDFIYHLAWSPDSVRLASTSSNDFFVNIWDVASHQKVAGPLRHSHGITSLAWDATGQRLATGSMDETIKIWNTASGQEHATLRGHEYAIVSLAWGADDSLTSMDDWGELRIWKKPRDQEVSVLPGETRVSSVAWSPDGQQLASGSDDGKLRIWDAGSQQLVSEFKAHREQGLILPSGEISSLAWSPNGKLLASASMDGTTRISAAIDGREFYRLPAEHGPLWSLAWNPTGTQLAIGADDGTLLLLTELPEQPQLRRLVTQPHPIRAVAWNAHGDRLAFAGEEGLLTLWDASRGKEIAQLSGHSGTVSDLAWSPTGEHIASAGTDHLVMVWAATSGQQLSSMRGHSTWVESVVWSPDSSRLASASMDGTVRIWDPWSGKEAFVLRGNHGRFHDVAWHPDGAQLAAASSDGQIWIWDASCWPNPDATPAPSSFLQTKD